MPVLVTGTAGFIGNEIARRLLAGGESVVGVDCVTPYYDVALKEARLARLLALPGFVESRADLADREATARLFAEHRPERVIHMAAQPGVRYSIDHPHTYADCNLSAFLNVLEGCRAVATAHLVYASSSSVYGGSETLPFSVHHPADHPVSLYAATKRANELMAHTTCTASRRPACGSSPSTGRGAGRTWRRCCSPGRFRKAGRSTSSTAARCAGTLPISTIS
jgi:UDP-glucuronate 4-epimerase